MSRPELIKLLKKKHPQLYKPQLETIIDTFFKSIEKALIENKSVELRGFGTFFIKEIKEKYSARNPKTGELVSLEKRNSVHFKPSKELKSRVNNKN